MGIRLVLADNDTAFRDSLCQLVAGAEDIDVVRIVSDGGRVALTAQRLKPDVLVMNIGMRGLNSIATTRQVVRDTPKINVLAVSMHKDKAMVLRMQQAGALGYLLEDAAYEEMLAAVRAVAGGRQYVCEQLAAADAS